MGHAKVISDRRKKKNKSDLLKDIEQLLALGLNMLVTAYMFAIIVVMPFYYTDGYAKIGTNKHEFLYGISALTGYLFVPALLAYLGVWIGIWIRDKAYQKWTLKGFWNGLSLTDKFALGYGAAVLLSYLFTDYKELTDLGSALKGAERWYMGLLTQLLLLTIYFSVSRLWKANKWIPALWLPVTVVVFGLGYLNRFEVRPLEMRNATYEFISTIGNINWYCGYVVIVFFGMLYYIWSQTEKKLWVNILFLLWLLLGFGTVLTQGSSSGIIAMAVALMVLYLLSMKSLDKLQMFFTCLVCLGMAAGITYCIRVICPNRFNYEDGLVDILTYSPLALILPGMTALFVLLLAYWTEKKKKDKRLLRFFRILGYGGVMAAGMLFVIFVFLGVINTITPGSIGKLSENAAFTFNASWGSLRGATWGAGWLCFAAQDFMGKLIGVGPDCMGMYIYNSSDARLLALVEEYFPGLYLTNAHCEWLTVLVNTGILGFVSYVGMMVSAICRYLRAGGCVPVAGACGFALMTYAINNLFSFQQSMGVATIFLVLGIGEAYMRGINRERSKP